MTTDFAIMNGGPRRLGPGILLVIVALALGSSCRNGDSEPESIEQPQTQEAPAPSDTASTTSQQTQPSTTAPDTSQGALLRDVGTTSAGMERVPSQARPQLLLEVDYLVSQGEVRQVSGYVGGLRRVPLEGQLPSREYNAFRLAADETYGFGLQVWKFRTNNLAVSHFNRMRETHVVSGSTRVDAETAFWASIGDIRQLVFLSSRRNNVVALSCDLTVCSESEILLDLAERVATRL